MHMLAKTPENCNAHRDSMSNKLISGLIFGLVTLYLSTKALWYNKFSAIDDLLVISCLGLFIFKYPFLFKSKIFIALILIAIAMLSSWLYGGFKHPQIQASSVKLHHLIPQFLFLIISIVFLKNDKKIILIWTLFVIGLLYLPFHLGSGLDEILNGINGQRVDFGFNNAQHTGVLYATALIGWIFLARRFIGLQNNRPIRLFIWIFILLFLTLITAITQTRMVFVGLGSLVILASMQFLFTGIKNGLKSHIIAAFALVIFFTLIIIIKSDYIISRFNIILPVLTPMIQGDWSGVPTNSLGFRIHMWRAGFEWFVESPIFGYGRNASVYIQNNTDWLLLLTDGQFRHLHSLYMELLVRYGLLGLAAYAVFFIFFVKKLHEAKKALIMPPDIYFFTIYFLIFYAITNSFEPYLLYHSGVIPFTIVMSLATSFIWENEIQKHTAKISRIQS